MRVQEPIDAAGDPDARRRIRAAHRASGRRIAVLDDDPTGSQAVHGLDVVLALDPVEYARALATAGATCFVLTNSRSMAEPEAARITRAAGRELFGLGARWGVPLTVISRSDSTLRGHVMAEVRALDEARREVLGRGHDGVLLVPAYFEAGRYTAGDTHWAHVAGRSVPVGETEFARDAAFGYTSSDLRDFVVERSGGEIGRGQVHGLTLDDIRAGGPLRVAQLLSEVSGGRFVVVNATTYADLEIVVLGLLEAERAGQAFLHRTGPSFVRALAGLEPQPPLSTEQIWPDGRPEGHGLVVVGSHVGLTNRQLAVAAAAGGLTELELDVVAVLDPTRRPDHVHQITDRVIAALARSDVLLVTSREVISGADPAAGLLVSRTVSAALSAVVGGALAARPRWVIAKGGITSHDVAVHGLGIRRAVVVGQLLPGMVSVFRPIEAAPDAAGTTFVVFAGNVGDEHTLAKVIDVVRGVRAAPGR